MQKIEQKTINNLRTLSIDMIEKANSGHPGMPMGSAPMAYTLWEKFLNISPENPTWFNRDRFVLAAGHGSSLLYSLMYLFGYEDVTMDQLKEFRQWGSLTPGHPEYRHTAGIDATSGPLGQGIGMAVGMALAEKQLAGTYNKPDFEVVDHYTYAICGDGDLMEGVSSEASSLAGHLGLDKLIVLYDSNDISLDGELNKSFSESVATRYEGYNWQVIRVEDGNNVAELTEALELAKSEKTKPTLIEVKTTIGFGSPNKAGSSASHGAPLGKEEALATKEFYGVDSTEPFFVDDDVLKHTRQSIEKGRVKVKDWNKLVGEYEQEYPELYSQFISAQQGKVLQFEEPAFEGGSSIATRSSSSTVLNSIAKSNSSLVGGSADLFSSNKTYLEGAGDFSIENPEGRNIWFGVREFAMGAILNGMALHGGMRVFGSTFFVFSDYVRPAMRLSALMGLPVTYIFTHDSIAVGEDGPTHEPIEHLASLRAMPNLQVIRPAEAKETVSAWKLIMTTLDKPSCLVLTRQNVTTLDLDQAQVDQGVEKGGYIVSPAQNKAEGLLIATGSEVSMALEAQTLLLEKNIDVSVVSLPAKERFESQSKEYQESVIPSHVSKRLVLELGTKFGWEGYLGSEGQMLGIETFGASAPAEVLLEKFGFTAENIVSQFMNL